jgi:integrase
VVLDGKKLANPKAIVQIHYGAAVLAALIMEDRHKTPLLLPSAERRHGQPFSNSGNGFTHNVNECILPLFKRIGKCLYRKGGAIYARVRVNGKQTWRSTGTNIPADARRWLAKWSREQWTLKYGIETIMLHRPRVTVGELINNYVSDGIRTRTGRLKSPATVKTEQACLKPLRAYFGNRQAAVVSLADCDAYRDWRISSGYEQRRVGTPSVDLELTILGNVFGLAVRRTLVKSNPLKGRGRYSIEEEIRHCREVAPTPEGLQQIEHWLRARNDDDMADVLCFLAYSGLRIGEALPLEWKAVDWNKKVLRVKREKRGIMPFVPILPEMEALLRGMQKRAINHLLFPSPLNPKVHRAGSTIRIRLGTICRTLGLKHVTPHGLRSYFVTQARQSGLSDAEVAMLIGDKTGPAIIARIYGDVRPDHLFKQAQRIRLTVQSGQNGECQPGSDIAATETIMVTNLPQPINHSQSLKVNLHSAATTNP